MMNLDQILNDIFPLPESSRLYIEKQVTEVIHPKGYILLNADKIEDQIYFIRKGIVRAYSNKEDKEITFWFGMEGDAVISMRSYVEARMSYETVELLEECELYCLRVNDIKRLYEKDIHIANWGRKFAEQELIKTEERLISHQFKSASEKYQDLIKHNPGLLQRVQLTYIASYLGITPVSLSRIRAEIK